MSESEDAKFTCSACHIEQPEEGPNIMTACRACGRIHCKDCIDEFGRCVECAQKSSSKT